MIELSIRVGSDALITLSLNQIEPLNTSHASMSK